MSTTDRYTRRHRIATGGMGEVWLAHDEVLHRDVAVKYLKREYADDEGARTRFLQEARNAAGLQHPGIATVFDFGESELEDDLPFLVMEYVDGRPLSELLAEGRQLDPEIARELVEQAATALAEAHAAGLVHRDVKPGNLMITTDGTVKITDFGIARAADGLSLTETGQIVGTPSYLSPEQAEGQSATPASDVYALGVVLFECLTGRRPYTADSPVAIALAHVREPVPELPADVPSGLAAVTTRALAKHPEDRYPDAGAFAAALSALGPEPTMFLSAPVVAAPVAAQTNAQMSAPTTATTSGRVSAILRAPRERVLWILGAALAVFIAGALLVAALTGGGATKDTPGPGSSPTTPRVTSSKPATVRVDSAAYIGKPVADVRAALTAMGLTSRVVTVDNPGGNKAGTVAALRPTGSVSVDETIALYVWSAEPKPQDKHDKGKGKGKH
jgi:tRNA A-37 threonylcarbamoyl transferase component Bud32